MSISNISDSIFIVASQNPSAYKFLISNSMFNLGNKLLKENLIKETQFIYQFQSRTIKLIELEIAIDSFQFVEMLHSEHQENLTLKIVPSKYICNILISSVNEISSASEIFYSLKQLTPSIKKLVLVDDPLSPGLNQKFCFVEYDNFHAAKNALKVINNKNISFLSNSDQLLFNKTFVRVNQNTDIAHFCEPFVDMVKETLYNTSCFFIESINFVININIFKLREFLEQYGVISSLRIYNQKVLVQYTSQVNKDLYEKPFFFEGKQCNVIPAMRPNKNIEKYRERTVKVLPFQLSEEDRQILISRFAENSVMLNELIRKKAENVANKIFNDNDFGNSRNNTKTYGDRGKYLEDGHNRNLKKRKRSDSYENNKVFSNNYGEGNKNMERYLNAKKNTKSFSPEKNVEKRKHSVTKQQTSSNNNTNQSNVYSSGSNNNGINQIPNNNNASNIMPLQLLTSLGLLANLSNNNPNILNMLQQLISTNTNSSLSQNKIPAIHPIQNPTPSSNISPPTNSNFTQSQVNPSYNFQHQFQAYPQNINQGLNPQILNPNLNQNMNPNVPSNYPTYPINQYNPEVVNSGYFHNSNIPNYDYQETDINNMNSSSYPNQNLNFDESLKKYFQNFK